MIIFCCCCCFLPEWINCQPCMHPEPAVKILCSGTYWGPAALFIVYFLTLSGGISGPHQTVGHDWFCSKCSEEWSQTEGRRSDPPQKKSRLFILTGELCFSCAVLLHVSNTGVFNPTDRSVSLGEQHRQEESQQQRPGFTCWHGDRESPEPAVDEGTAEQEGRKSLGHMCQTRGLQANCGPPSHFKWPARTS